MILLRNDVKFQSSFAADATGTAKLIDTIKAVSYDGATSLGSLILPKNQSDYTPGDHLRTPKDYDLFLLFTDGFGNYRTTDDPNYTPEQAGEVGSWTRMTAAQ